MTIKMYRLLTLLGRTFENCLKTQEWTPLEPDVVENKYYAPCVGVVLEVAVEGGPERVELVEVRTQ